MRRILFIDDEKYKAQAIIAYFKEICGWSVDLAADPDEALAAIAALSEGSVDFDLILLDIMMDPGKLASKAQCAGGKNTGLVLLPIIWDRLKRAGNKIPIVVYTARIDLDQMHQDERVARYIQKPRLAEELVRDIEDVLGSVGT